MARVMPEHAPLPGRSAAGAQIRLRKIVEAFIAAGPDYSDETFTACSEYQDIRTPDEVFVNPRLGNCLDLSVAFASACLDAGLHPIIVLVDSTRVGQPGHALTVVWLRGDWAGLEHRGASTEPYPFEETLLTARPCWPGTGLRETWRGHGEFVAIDIARVTRDHRGGASPTLDEIVERGTAVLTGDRWSWRIGIDVGLAYPAPDPHPVPDWPRLPPLDPPYHEKPTATGPLANIRARNNVVRFEERPELHQLLQWCHARDTANKPRVVGIRGVGGCGKTRLAAELAHLLATEGWYTGFLREDLLADHEAAPIDDDAALPESAQLAIEWLARVNQPLLIVVDYIEAIPTAALIVLLRHLSARRRRTVVVMTARDTGDWSRALDRGLDKAGIRVDRHPDLTLKDRHPHPETVFLRAFRAFAALVDSPGDLVVEPPGGAHRWTTLDLIFHAWIAAHNATRLPNKRENLYEEILDREFDNWNNALASRFGMHEQDPKKRKAVPIEGLRRIVAGISLLTPAPATLTAALRVLGLDDYTTVPPGELAEVLRPFIHDTATERLALRPDVLADHLIINVFGSDRTYFDTVVDRAERTNQASNIAATLTRAADDNSTIAEHLAERMLARHPNQWRAALSVAFTRGGPFVGPLETLATEPDTPLPLAELADLIPERHSLGKLALIASTHLHESAATATNAAAATNIEQLAERARLLNNLSVRQAGIGDREAALTSIVEAVGHYRRMVDTNPAAFLPNLAGSLNTLSNQQAEIGDREAALTSIVEAV
ncbi:hypothetical protein, partial [Nocardia sp. CC213A]|uniref:hypothetical protein n=1 Tax=Nocardia sp. CC213A TaxID=3044157 RepID=UPI00278BC529